MDPSGPEPSLVDEFHRTGRDLFLAGLNSSHSGNMSVRRGERIIITRRGAALGRLSAGDLVEVALDGGEPGDGAGVSPSSELVVHRAVYRAAAAGAVIHAHPPHAVALSLHGEVLAPVDVEGRMFLGEVPILAAGRPAGSDEVAGLVSAALRDRRVVIVRGHGSFAAGGDLEEAWHWTSALEHAARMASIHRLYGGGGR